MARPRGPVNNEGYVCRNSVWSAVCPVHGVTDHGDVIGGRCFKCQQKGLEEQGLVVPQAKR